MSESALDNARPIPVTPEDVVAVLLTDGWHRVVPGSFAIGALAFGPLALGHAGGDSLGFSFEEENSLPHAYGPATIAGPLTGVLAVRQVTGRRQHEPSTLPQEQPADRRTLHRFVLPRDTDHLLAAESPHRAAH